MCAITYLVRPSKCETCCAKQALETSRSAFVFTPQVGIVILAETLPTPLIHKFLFRYDCSTERAKIRYWKKQLSRCIENFLNLGENCITFLPKETRSCVIFVQWCGSVCLIISVAVDVSLVYNIIRIALLVEAGSTLFQRQIRPTA